MVQRDAYALTRMRQLELFVPERLASKYNHQAVQKWQIEPNFRKFQTFG